MNGDENRDVMRRWKDVNQGSSFSFIPFIPFIPVKQSFKKIETGMKGIKGIKNKLNHRFIPLSPAITGHHRLNPVYQIGVGLP
jgi:hypothetical protein